MRKLEKKKIKLIACCLIFACGMVPIGFFVNSISTYFFQTPLNPNSDLLITPKGVPYWNGTTGIWNLTHIRSEVGLNPVFMSNQTITYSTQIGDEIKNFNLNLTIWKYSAMLYEGDILNVSSALVLPDNSSGTLNQTPGMLLIHGIYGKYDEMLSLAYFYAAHNISVLAISLPGHGASDGPPPIPENILPIDFIQGLTPADLNYTHPILKKLHFYLSTVAGIRGLDFLMSRNEVNASELIVVGGSYGGLQSYFISTVAHENVSLTIPLGISGDFRQSYLENKFIRLMIPKVDFNDPDFLSLVPYFDPLYYTLNSSETPPMCMAIGTNDEFWSLRSVNNHFNSINTSTKAISLSPGAHHGPLLRQYVGTSLYFINHILDGGPAPPHIEILESEIIPTPINSFLKIRVNISSSYPIDTIKIAYHYNVLGHPWIEVALQKVGNFYEVTIPSYLISSYLDYVILVEMTGPDGHYILFSTAGYQSYLHSAFTAFFFLFLFIGIAIPGLVLAYRRYEKVRETPEGKSLKQKVGIFESAKFCASFGTSVGIILAYLYLPLVIINPTTQEFALTLGPLLEHFSGLLMINGLGFVAFNTMSYVDFVLLTIVGVIFLSGFLITLLVVLIDPLKGGILNLSVNMVIFVPGLILQSMGAQFGVLLGLPYQIQIIISSAVYFPTILAGIQIALGFYNRSFWKKIKRTAGDLKEIPKRKEDYSYFTIIFSNFLLIIAVIVGFIGLSPITFLGIPLASLIYVGIILLMHLFILRKVLCTTCVYHGRRCHTGWGLIAGLLFEKKDSRDFSKKSTWLLPTTFWIGFVIVPTVIMAVIMNLGTEFGSFLQIFYAEGFVMAMYLLLSTGVLFFIMPVMGCRFCKEKERCLGAKAFPLK